MNQKTTFFSLLLVIALGFSFWAMHYHFQGRPPILSKRTETPDTFMLKAAYMRFDKEGQLHDKISVPRMVHYQTNDVSDFNHPNLIIYGEKKQQPWHISADYGRSQHGAEQIHLWSHVNIQQPNSPDHPGLAIATSSLVIYPKTQIALTDQAVTIKQPDAVVTSVGLRANFKTDQVELLSHAHAIYNIKD